MSTRFFFYLTSFSFLLTFGYSFGQNDSILTLSPDFQHVSVRKPFLHQFADAEHPHVLSQIRQLSAEHWQTVNSANFGSKGSPGWIMFSVQSPIKQTVWLELESHFIDSVQVWLIQQPGLPNEIIKAYQPTGFRSLRDDPDAPAQHPFFLKQLHLSPNVHYAIYIRGWVPPGDVLKFDVNLWKPTPFATYQQKLIAGWSVFIGLVLMSVFITLVSYLFHPQRIYLYYCGYVLGMSVYALLNDGWIVFLPHSLRWFDSTSRAAHWLSLGILFLMLFSRRFLYVDLKTSWWWLRLNPLWLALLVEAATFVVDFGIHHNHFTLIQTGYRVGFGVLAIYALLWLSYVADALRRKFRPVWLYLGSVLVWLFFYITNVFIVNTGWLTEPFPDMLIFRIALLFEVALIFIGWMYRQRIIRESEQRLQLQEESRQQALFDAERKRQAEELKALRLQNELQQQREQLARDLHDGIGSQLTHIAGRLDILSSHKTDEQPQLQRLSLFTRETNQALRDTVWILNRSEIRLSAFAQRLNSYLLRIWEDLDMPRLDWYSETLPPDSILPPLVAQCLFRITQEAVNNALKYAEATTIRISLTNQETIVRLAITDNGKGFDQACITPGYGLKNMQKRAEEIGGSYILSSTNSGTQIEISVSINN